MRNKPGIHWITEVEVKPECIDIFPEHIQKMLDLVEKTEPRTMEYLCYMSPDGRLCQVDQWFADVNAALHHLHGEAAKLNSELATLADVRFLWLYSGSDEEQITSIFDSWGIGDKIVKSRLTGGFERWGQSE